MKNKKINTREIAVSGLVIALYVVIMYFTQSFSFGQYQIRIATALYALAFLFPYLVLPLGLANCLSNILGGSPIDMIGGLIIGLITAGIIALIKKQQGKEFLVFLPILLVPGLGVPVYLSKVIAVPYKILAPSLLIGQIVPAIVGVLLIIVLKKYVENKIIK